ncbi:uncharacterized protein [Primulina huaijiensis]|uniref:uncharacterized protein n=1 Tax=Primulina huaijiensis TaxID=1492673 RepID=UPI003CC751B7
MVQERIVLGHKISEKNIEVDKAKVDVIKNLPPPTSVKGIRIFLGHAGFYRRFIRDFSKIAKPISSLQMKEVPFDFNSDFFLAYENLKERLVTASVLVSQNWDLPPFEAESYATNDAQVVLKTLKKNIFNRFGTPGVIISDGDTHFCNKLFDKILGKYGVSHKISTPYHPQTSGQVEVSNRDINRILEKVVTPVGTTPYRLLFRKACHLPFELEHRAYWATKALNLDFALAGEHMLLQLNRLEEFRGQAYDLALTYKGRTKQAHDKHITLREFKEGEAVLLYNFKLRLFFGNLKSRWTGPYMITKVFPSGAITLRDEKNEPFTVNSQ